MRSGITILICTYNGAHRLPETLRCIAAQQLPAAVACELVIVDNASTDDSIATIHREWQQYDSALPLRIITEPNPGLTYARNTGFASARYDYIILCDDDNRLSPGYAHKAFTIMEQHPDIGILGGHGHFVFETPPPAWLLADNLYAGGPQARQSGPVNNHLVYGAGAVLRKAAWEMVCARGFVSALTDRQGYQLSSGGDHELCYVLTLAGYRIWYEDSLHFDHFIEASRLTLPYYLTYIEESSHCFYVLEPYKILLKTQKTSSFIFRWELLKSYGYHVRKMGGLFLKRLRTPGIQYHTRLQHKLQHILLRRRIQSYRHYAKMENHFLEVVKLQRKLKQPA